MVEKSGILADASIGTGFAIIGLTVTLEKASFDLQNSFSNLFVDAFSLFTWSIGFTLLGIALTKRILLTIRHLRA